MEEQPTCTPRELAHRSSQGLEVTLLWIWRDREDMAVICVCDARVGAYFEIPTEAYLALEVYNHPFAYRDFSSVDFEDDLLAA